MDLVSLLIAVIVIGIVIWLVQTLPIAEPFRTIAWVIVVVLVLMWLLGNL